MANPLVSDRNVEFMLYEVLRADELCALPYFAGHSRETFAIVVGHSGDVSHGIAAAGSAAGVDASPGDRATTRRACE